MSEVKDLELNLPLYLGCGYGKHHHLVRECNHHHTKVARNQRAFQMAKDATIPASVLELGPSVEGAVPRWTQVSIHSAYYGQVPLNCLQLSPKKFVLLYPVPGKPDVYVKVVSATANRIDIMNPRKNYTWMELANYNGTVVDVDEHAQWAAIAYPLREKEQQGTTLTADEQKQLHDMNAKLHVVDIHFAITNYVEFLHKLGRNRLTDAAVLVCVHDAKQDGKDVDNAFFMGPCFVFGNGYLQFRAMGTIDIVGHEATHALASNLAYQGHAGAMNEAFADAGGAAFERYMYDKFPGIKGQPDFLMGEDNTIGKDNFLRSMSDPPARQQPKQYRDMLWKDPNEKFDEGNVHTNSGLGNHLFYLLCQSKANVIETFRMMASVYQSLAAFASYPDLRDALKKANPGDTKVTDALKAVWLTDDVVTDWYPGNPKKRGAATASKQSAKRPRKPETSDTE